MQRSRHIRRRALKRTSTGIHLVEMVVAVGLSGIFIAVLSGMLSENLRIGTTTTNDLIANQILDELEENTLNTPYETLKNNLPGTTQLVVVAENESQAAQQKTQALRKIPLQQNLAHTSIIWGAVDPITGQFDINNRWIAGRGNFFRGTASQTIEDTGGTMGSEALKVTFTVTFSNSTTNTGTRQRTRAIYVFPK
jgi:hypothetical protein